MRVLVVEDHPDLAQNLGEHLEEAGHAVDYALNGLTALHLLAEESFDAVVLDLALPLVDGLTVCRRVRALGQQVPILMLTARDTLDDKLAGFAAGADDYLVKPFALEELAARLGALDRRHRRRGRPAEVLRVGDLELDPGACTVRRGGRELELHGIGFEILRILMTAAPAVVRKEELAAELWAGAPPQSHALRTHVYQVRQVIDKPFASPLVETVHGVGYRLRGAGAGEAPGPEAS
jgi:DNA-binding response OmpR family regulator